MLVVASMWCIYLLCSLIYIVLDFWFACQMATRFILCPKSESWMKWTRRPSVQERKDQRLVPTELNFLTIVGLCVGLLLEESTYVDCIDLYSNRCWCFWCWDITGLLFVFSCKFFCWLNLVLYIFLFSGTEETTDLQMIISATQRPRQTLWSLTGVKDILKVIQCQCQLIMFNLQWPLTTEGVSKHIESTCFSIFMMVKIRICKLHLLCLTKCKKQLMQKKTDCWYSKDYKTGIYHCIYFCQNLIHSQILLSNLENKK